MKRMLRKNQVIITTLAIMIAVAGYLNYSGKLLEEESTDAVSTDDSTILVTDTVSDTYTDYSDDTYEDIVSLEDDGIEEAALEGEEVSEASIGEAVLASSQTTASSLLAEARLNREQVRAKSREELEELIERTDIEEEQKQDAITVMTQMSQISEMEADAELLLEAKGFDGCVVSITDGTADVVVNATELTDAQRAQIEDVVKRKTEISGDKIVISPISSEN